MHVQWRPINKPEKKVQVVPKAIARKTGINKSSPQPKTKSPFTKDNQPKVLTAQQRWERVNFIYDLMLDNVDKPDIRDLYCEKYGVKPAWFEPWYAKARDQMASDFSRTRDDRRKFYDKKVKDAVNVCFQRHDMKSAAPLLDWIAKYKAEYGKEEKDDKAINIHFSLADLHKHVEQQNPWTTH